MILLQKKINIKIKPIAQLTPSKMSASVDELRATVGTWKSMANVNLVKPNSRRSLHQSTLQLNRASTIMMQERTDNILSSTAPLQPTEPMMMINTRLNQPPVAMPPPVLATAANLKAFLVPVAFATQECLHVRTLMSSDGESATSLIGHIKMAAPRQIVDMNPSYFVNNVLAVNILTSKRWSSCSTNQQFAKEIRHGLNSSQQNIDTSTYAETKQLSIDMNQVYLFARQSYQKQPESKYFLLPELMSHTIRSHDVIGADENNQLGGSAATDISPIRAVAHWLCDLDVTKVRIDLEFLEDLIQQQQHEDTQRLKPSDIENVKLVLQVNGKVLTQQSKPAATWSPVSSQLTWSFNNMAELIDMATTVSGISSCLAKMDLDDGPSTPSDVSLQFSINGKTLSGTKLLLPNPSAGYKIVRQKCEVKTGTFKCEPPRL